MTAELTFARTRIQPPRVRNDLINRPALEAALRQALAEQRLTLIVAPAGWGKTSSLARQIAQLPTETALAWLTADADDDLPRFLAGLTAALAPFDLPWRVAPMALANLLQTERGPRAVADEIVNVLSDSEVSRGLLIIDDAHRWKDRKLFELLAAVIDHAPSHWGVVLSSRAEPALPTARWRARGDLAEFRQSALRFSVEEIREMLQSKGLAAEGAEDLEKRTQGWAVGLRLMLSVGKSAMQGSGQSQRDVFDYLASEVLEQMTPDMQQFLLRCSVLPELMSERCAQVSGLENAPALFSQLEREGLFVTPLDDSSKTLRLHDLFRDFLQERLQRDHAAEVPALLMRAAEDEPNLLRTVTWLVRAGAVDRAAAELAARGPALLPIGGQADLMHMFAMLPSATVESNPDLSFLRGKCALLAFDFELLASTMAVAERGYLANNRPELAVLASIMKYCGRLSSGGAAEAGEGLREIRRLHSPVGAPGAMVAYLLAYVAQTELRIAEILPAIVEMVEKLESDLDSPAWEDVNFLMLLVLYPGAPAVFARHLRNATARHDSNRIATRLSASHIRATLAFGEGRFAQALEHLANADEDMEWLGRPRLMQEENNALHAYVNGLIGNAADARRAAELNLVAWQQSPRAYRRVHSGLCLSVPLRTYWLLRDDDGVRTARDALHAAADAWEWGTASLVRGLGDGMVALIDKDWRKAEQALLAIAKRSRWSHFGLGLIAEVLAAESQRQQGRLEAAADTLRGLLADAHLPHAVGCALLAGPHVIRNLASANWGKRLSLTEQAELTRWTTLGSTGGQSAQADADGLPAGLTNREAEVLDLITKGHSNKLIARDLSLSLFTVKRHVANILGKTALATRTELATWWLGKRKSH